VKDTEIRKRFSFSLGPFKMLNDFFVIQKMHSERKQIKIELVKSTLLVSLNGSFPCSIVR